MREMIHEFKYQTLVLFKALLLQPKVCPQIQHGKPKLTPADALLRFALRASMHDSILPDLPDTRPLESSRRLRGPGIRQLHTDC